MIHCGKNQDECPNFKVLEKVQGRQNPDVRVLVEDSIASVDPSFSVYATILRNKRNIKGAGEVLKQKCSHKPLFLVSVLLAAYSQMLQYRECTSVASNCPVLQSRDGKLLLWAMDFLLAAAD